MIASFTFGLTIATVWQSVPDSGATALLLGGGILGLGMIARFIKNRKK